MCLRQQSSEEAVFLNLPILSQVAPESFDYGRVFLVEFEPQSLWYEATFTITADSLKKGIRTEYHTYSTFQRTSESHSLNTE